MARKGEKLFDEKISSEKGEFKRKDSTFRSWITKDGSSGFPAESGRYHLYVSYACPWAHRTLITRVLKGLEECISVDVVDYFLGGNGWRFDPDVPGATSDTVNGFKYMKEVYFLAEKDYGGRFTVPVLWDKKTKTIVNNESSEILRMLNSEFNAFCSSDEQRSVDLYPENTRKQIDELNEWIYRYACRTTGELRFSLLHVTFSFFQGHQQWCLQSWFCHSSRGI